ncbi:16S rRNA (guanine(527)-N(7))-methyltransferase RsmG [Chitinimonas arctica]|uniref:Ribosomal RNA small subunit methyltransferase G n=1 Tax=Chitinimonas arctica TaxID=2594795 RepID=A0A516SFX5_9NEIS|nr:16S rRNA (guanine(527)-N(7))-methyltransferase RsmG [Chitinimonas arctica]QDQ27066.1 16S rRNA (guanine(527)-N(7))-methyltransferase RsmG [Chitinimonas arctica]
MIGHRQEQQLREGLAELGLPLADTAVERLLAYLGLLLKWNKTYSLTAITEPERMVSHHLLDSLAAYAPIAAHAPTRLLDVGSGGGQPGIPLAIAQPDWHITLLDSNHKKTAFLRQAVIELGLNKQVEVVCDRVENVQPAQAFDLITSRAFADLADFSRLTRHLLADGGRWAALKGVQPFEEISALPENIHSEITPLAVPGLGAERCIVWMTPR